MAVLTDWFALPGVNQTRIRNTETGTSDQANTGIAKNKMTKNKTESRAKSYR
jgi:hypothetical protein